MSAHAQLLEVAPADGAVVATAPAEVVLRFNEPVLLDGGSVRVLDDDAVDVATAAAPVDDAVVVTLGDAVAEGTYTIVWEVVSVDSHRIGGASVFHVGAPTSEGLAGTSAADSGGEAGWGVRLGATLLTTVGYADALVAGGVLLFSLYSHRVAGLTAIVGRAAVGGAVALLASAPFRIARLGGGLGALRSDDVLLSSLRGPVGVAIAVSAVGLLAVAALVDRRGGLPWALGAAVVALAGFTIEGHTRSNDPRWAMLAADVVHLCAGAVWLGGIVALVIMFRSEDDAGRVAAAVRRFSTVALGAVGVVSVTGALMAWVILPSLGELTSTGYGWALITKVVLVLVVIGIGAFNRFRLVAAVDDRERSPGRSQDRSARRLLSRLVVAELAILLAAVAVTAVMVTRSPLSSVSAAEPAPAATSQSLEIVFSDEGGTADVSVSPASTGFNVVDVVLRDVEGRIVNPVEAPVIQLTQPALDVGPLEPEVLGLAIGRYQATVSLGFVGEWELTIRVRVDDFTSVIGTAPLRIG